MLIRLFLAAVVILIAFYVLRQWRRARATPRKPISADILPCQQCGLHIPKQEAIGTAGNYFCCEEHRAEYQKTH